MDELCSYSILQHVRSKKISNLCRILILSSTTLSSEKVSNFFNDYARQNFDDRVTGLMLVYPNYTIQLIESIDENLLFQVCSYLLKVEPKIFRISKYFFMQMSMEIRFFEKWYVRRLIDDFSGKFSTSNELEQIDNENFENVTKIYRKLTKDLYFLFNDLREANITSRACLIERLDKIVTTGDCHLPEEKIIASLVESRWGDSLEKLVENYWNEIRSIEIDDELWPFPEKMNILE